MNGALEQHGFTAILASKLNPPRQALNLLKRERLLALLDWHGVVLLLAPAGFGKTTLLGHRYEQIRSEGGLAFWLTADEDDDPVRFLAHLLAALAPHSARIGDLQQRFSRLGFSPKAAHWALMEALEAARPLTIILDDVHRVQNSETQGLLQNLVERAPSNVSLLLGARSKPPVRTGILKAQGILRTVGVDELRFTEREAAEYFRAELGGGDLERLMEFTEGWPVALQLWRLWRRENRGTLESSLIGSPAAVSEYLSEEIFNSLEESEREFLLQTSILEEVNATIADALTLRTDGNVILQRIHDKNLPISCTDTKGEWYRYHRLFADFLHEKLTKLEAAAVPELHRKAAEWFAANGRFQDALRHAFGTRDQDYVVRLVEKLGGWQLALTGGASILKRLAGIELQVMERFPRARLGQIYLMAQDGDISRARAAFDALRASTHDFEELYESVSRAGLKEESIVVDSVIRIYEDLPVRVLDIERIRAGAGDDGPLNGPVSWLFGNLLCYAYFDSGEYDRARSLGYLLLQDSKLEAIPYAQNYLYAYMAISCLRKGRLEEAANLLRTMKKKAESLFGPASNQAAISAALLAEIRISRGDRSAAKKLLGEFLSIVEQSDGWFDIYASAYQTSSALAQLELGPSAAADVWQRAGLLAEERGLTRLRGLGKAELARVLARWGRNEEAAEILRTDCSEWLDTRRVLNARELLVPARVALARAWLLIRSGDVEAGLECVRRLQSEMRRCGLADRTFVEAAVAEATACHLIGDSAGAHRIWKEIAESGRGGELDLVVEIEGEICRQVRIAPHTAEDARGSRFLPDGRSLVGQACERNLTRREQDIACELADGFSNKEIARRLHVAPATIKVPPPEHLQETWGSEPRRRDLVSSRAGRLGQRETYPRRG